jgi:acyl carrier protein
MTESTTSLTEEAIVGWLVEQTAQYLQMPPDTVLPTVPLVEYGLDSVFTFALCADIEDRFGLPVEPTLAWDYPRIEQIARFIHHELSA